jgi:hypothetical protein
MSRRPHFSFANAMLALALAVLLAWWFFRPPATPPPDRQTGAGNSALLSNRALDGSAPDEFNFGAEAKASDSDEELLQRARLLVQRSPSLALAWAQATRNPALHARLLRVVARAWGEVDPVAAVAWARRQLANRSTLLAAVAAGAVRQPDLAVAVGRQLLAQDAIAGQAFGTGLVDALGADGQFSTALAFAATAPANFQEDWTAAAVRHWAQNQPADAVAALDNLADPDLRAAAFRAVVQGWSSAQPSSLAAFALSLPPGDERSYALDQSLYHWVRQDPVQLANWLYQVPFGPDYDDGVQFLLNETDQTNLPPALAVQWAGTISDQNLRQNYFQREFDRWVQTDPSAAHHYLQSSPNSASAADNSAASGASTP